MADDLSPEDRERHERARAWAEQVIRDAVPDRRVDFSRPTDSNLMGGGIEYRMEVLFTVSNRDEYQRLADRLLGLNPALPPDLRLSVFQVIPGPPPERRGLFAVYRASCDS